MIRTWQSALELPVSHQELAKIAGNRNVVMEKLLLPEQQYAAACSIATAVLPACEIVYGDDLSPRRAIEYRRRTPLNARYDVEMRNAGQAAREVARRAFVEAGRTRTAAMAAAYAAGETLDYPIGTAAWAIEAYALTISESLGRDRIDSDGDDMWQWQLMLLLSYYLFGSDLTKPLTLPGRHI
jgi:hypothetical protein